jgi:hypothetical protein
MDKANKDGVADNLDASEIAGTIIALRLGPKK